LMIGYLQTIHDFDSLNGRKEFTKKPNVNQNIINIKYNSIALIVITR
jgi:hypothetical protein